MKVEELRALQAPLKARYQENPSTALVTCRARGTLNADGVSCTVETKPAPVVAGLHRAAGGDGSAACAGDMLLEALVACAGVTLQVVATALRIPLRGGTVTAEGDMDFRGTLGLSKEVPVGFQAVRLHFDFDTDATSEQIANLIRLTERYCVVYQTLQKQPSLTTTSNLPGS